MSPELGVESQEPENVERCLAFGFWLSSLGSRLLGAHVHRPGVPVDATIE